MRCRVFVASRDRRRGPLHDRAVSGPSLYQRKRWLRRRKGVRLEHQHPGHERGPRPPHQEPAGDTADRSASAPGAARSSQHRSGYRRDQALRSDFSEARSAFVILSLRGPPPSSSSALNAVDAFERALVNAACALTREVTIRRCWEVFFSSVERLAGLDGLGVGRVLRRDGARLRGRGRGRGVRGGVEATVGAAPAGTAATSDVASIAAVPPRVLLGWQAGAVRCRAGGQSNQQPCA